MARLSDRLQVRLSPADRALLDAQAATLGVAPATLMRRVTVAYLLERARADHAA